MEKVDDCSSGNGDRNRSKKDRGGDQIDRCRRYRQGRSNMIDMDEIIDEDEVSSPIITAFTPPHLSLSSGTCIHLRVVVHSLYICLPLLN